MKIMSEFGKNAPNKVFISLMLGVSAGILYVGLIPLVLSSLDELPGIMYTDSAPAELFGYQISNLPIAFAFFSLCLLILIFRTVSQIMLTAVSLNLTMKVRENLYQRVSSSPIDVLEKIGSPRIINTMTMDVRRIVDGASMAPPMLVSLATVAGMMFYIWIENSKVFYFVCSALLVGVISYQIPIFIGRKYMLRARELMDELQEGFRGVILGAKELKLNRKKKDNFIKDELLAVESKIESTNIRAETVLTSAMNYGDMIGFFAIGLLAFVYVNYEQVSNSELIAIIMILLYISSPVGAILSAIPVFISANVSYKRMEEIYAEMVDEDSFDEELELPCWQQIQLKNVTYTYNDEHAFKAGPVDLTIKKGQITFIVGGNGSGKSTISKVITQHYYPTTGHVCFDDVQINRSNINSYRQTICSIYSDYYLFKTLHGIDLQCPKVNAKIHQLIKDLALDGKIKFENGRFSTTKLSDGQRRRLALLVAVMEDKDLYVFDEWAADQDAVFRKVFYEQILPELKQKGKAVVAISHDDRYFHLADQIIKFESGLRV
ncbi:cyclic peptide export ABC transporter [Pseudoalteromonas sp. A22]|uniref:Cyclic peptide export ABC transporter n=1 Tax=Pseudoalteromonas maricaloris TaxID=184924 RepID=A0A8I2H799_9GAMM|nr:MULTISPECIES: cyclic peptide export ABC transporter [Pseudoalteromonas]NLR24356.1 cyclic peptide export ABC transporter [Pseudoalteromonas maricaloris]QUI62048.1 cyclic peptide export ABC transporter [Pseudoalteromonas sp. A22]RZG18142.1 cyclic peptide export ABC transporter [Pseudoalteromonas sp. CO342X]USE67698.1 cyclic peptide transporter [Pseudoalteromonas flavipulchra]WMO15174.1 cyclic peptide export ABC transporter [Pseudoalteromonas piscicida]